MKLTELFNGAIETGRQNDPRGAELVEKELAARKKEYDGLSDKQKALYDADRLTNPYPDSRILHMGADVEVQSALVGIDIEVGEILLAHALRQKGERIDAVIAHHPEGMAYAKLHDVMKMQADILGRFGVSISAAEALIDERMADVERKILPVNHTRAVDAARLLGIPFINLHTPADNMVASYLQNLFETKKPFTLDDVMDLILDIAEYKAAAKGGAGPKILLGSGSRKAGRVFVDMTGGTEGSKDIFSSISQSGINTIVGMHFSEDHRKEADKHHLNMIIAGHISSDNLGMNLLFDAVMQKTSKFKILDCSGFGRVARQ